MDLRKCCDKVEKEKKKNFLYKFTAEIFYLFWVERNISLFENLYGEIIVNCVIVY